MTRDDLNRLLERHRELIAELRDIHLGRLSPATSTLAAREHQISESLQAISAEVAEHQFREQPEGDTRDKKDRMTELALTFPSLSVDTPGLVPWDQDKLNDWVQSGGPSSGERATGEFLLYVWNPFDDTPWAGRFNLADVLKTWDIFHCHAFLKWAADPLWP